METRRCRLRTFDTESACHFHDSDHATSQPFHALHRESHVQAGARLLGKQVMASAGHGLLSRPHHVTSFLGDSVDCSDEIVKLSETLFNTARAEFECVKLLTQRARELLPSSMMLMPYRVERDGNQCRLWIRWPP